MPNIQRSYVERCRPSETTSRLSFSSTPDESPPTDGPWLPKTSTSRTHESGRCECPLWFRTMPSTEMSTVAAGWTSLPSCQRTLRVRSGAETPCSRPEAASSQEAGAHHQDRHEQRRRQLGPQFVVLADLRHHRIRCLTLPSFSRNSNFLVVK